MNLLVIPNLEKENTVNTAADIRRIFPADSNRLMFQQIYRSRLSEYGDVFDDDVDALLAAADAVIAIGGDGTIIHTAKLAAEAGKPIIGINSGYLGFTAELEPTEAELLSTLKDGNFRIEERMMLEVRVISEDGSEKLRCNAINDAVINRGALARMINLSVSVNGRPSLSYRADGLILSTPTGSTAYALSAGGPIISPLVNCIPVTPICPHELSSRTIIFDQNDLICVSTGAGRGNVVSDGSSGNVYITVDGERACELEPGDSVAINRSPVPVKFIKLKDVGFSEVLKAKLKH